MVNPPACEVNNGSVVHLGDVCVSPFSVSFDCWEATWTQTCNGVLFSHSGLPPASLLSSAATQRVTMKLDSC